MGNIKKVYQERTIKVLTKADIDDYLKIYFNSYPAFKDIGDNGHRQYYEKTLRTMEAYKDVHLIGMYEDEKLIATMKIVDFSMNLFGEIKQAAGLMALGVDPLHKKAKAALEMVKYFEDYVKKNGKMLALLLPFRADFYRKMGYGFESRMYQYHIPMSGLPSCTDMSKLRFLRKDDFDKVLQCYREAVALNHGMIDKFGEEKRDMEADSVCRRVGYYDGERLEGYITYNCICDSNENYTLNHIAVTEMIYHKPEILRALMGYIKLQEDQAQSVVVSTGEEDFYQILDSPQDISGNYIDFGYLQTNTAFIGIMHKISEPEDFVEKTDYRLFPPYELVLEIEYNNELDNKTQSILIEFTKDGNGLHSNWRVAEKTRKADVTLKCKMSDMASIFMGSCSVAALVRMGSVQLSDTFYLEQLEHLFHVSQKPWSNTDF